MKVTRRVALLIVTFFSVTSAGAVDIATVPVGNPGNAGDVQPNGTFGSVPYTYRIGKYEVTNAQYVEFLNGVDPTGANALGLYFSFMTSDARGGINFNAGAANGSKYEIKPGRDNNPVVYVSWYDTIRFANWLHNGQGSGDTEMGAYTLGAIDGAGVPIGIGGSSISRNPGARWWLPSENEWYKAAYHKNDGVTGNFWDYPTSSNVLYSDQPPGSDAPTQSNAANVYEDDGIANGYDDGYGVTGSGTFVNSQNYLTDVGAYTLSTSPYGTFDQGGNVWEWNETFMPIPGLTPPRRGLRGGSWNNLSLNVQAAARNNAEPRGDANIIGFRIATIPEPSTLLLLAVGGLALLSRRFNPAARPG